ncbi:hypothetical protein KR054_012264, partial [Drosophila jambulina]
QLVSPQVLEVLGSFLKDRIFQVVQDGICSTVRGIAAGVPQDSVLGPTLCNVFSHDALLQPRRSRNCMCTVTYADDTRPRQVCHTLNSMVILFRSFFIGPSLASQS